MSGRHIKPVQLRNLFIQGVGLLFGIIPLLAALAYVVPPSSTVIFQWMGLLMPLWIVLNIMLLGYSLYFKRLHYSIPLLSLVGSLYYLPLIVQWNASFALMKGDLRVATYNVRGLKSQYGFSTLVEVADFAARNTVDVLFMQEVPADYVEDDLRTAFRGLPYVLLSVDERGGNRLAILSKYPLSAAETLSFAERPQYALFATMAVGGEQLKLINCHLQTTNWNQVRNKEYIDAAYSIVSQNFERRARQTRTISAKMDSTIFPIVLAGDFNAPPVSYSYHRLGSKLKDGFCEAGNGYGYTYSLLKKLFRIDYVFFTGEAFEAFNYRTENLNYSDHLPVLIDLVIKKK